MASSGRKVLICVDKSKTAEEAFIWYFENCWKEGDIVTVATKVEFNIHFGFFGPSDERLKEILAQSKKCQDEVDILTADFAEKMRTRKVQGSAVTVTGDLKAGEDLIKKADEIGANLIVVGTRGLGTVKRALLGSVSDYIVKHAHCPVIVVRPETAEKPEDEGQVAS